MSSKFIWKPYRTYGYNMYYTLYSFYLLLGVAAFWARKHVGVYHLKTCRTSVGYGRRCTKIWNTITAVCSNNNKVIAICFKTLK